MVNIDGENKKVVGIIVECNPFHKGHARLIKECKKHGDFIVAVMSGNFVQRGEPAVYDKYKRTKDLLKSGVDLVIELPVEYVLSSAKYFASTGVKILNSLGFVDYIMFGSKIGDIDELKGLASIDIDEGSQCVAPTIMGSYNSPVHVKGSQCVAPTIMGSYNSPVHVKGSYNSPVHVKGSHSSPVHVKGSHSSPVRVNSSPVQKLLKEGKSYAAAIGEVLGKKLSSNDILAIEYIRALNEIKSKIEPLTIKRKNDLPTASKLREKIKKSITCDSLSDILNYKLLLAKNLKENTKENTFSNIYLMTNDMENAILNSVSNKGSKKNISFTERAMKLKTKNVTLAFIKRLLFNIIFDIRKNEVVLKKINWVRVLGFKKESSDLIKQIKTPVLMSYSHSSYKSFVKKYKTKVIKQNKNGDFILNSSLQKNIFASDLYYLLSNQKLCEAEWQVVVG